MHSVVGLRQVDEESACGIDDDADKKSLPYIALADSLVQVLSAPVLPPRASIHHEAPQVPIHWQGAAPPLRKTMTAQLTERDVQPFLAAARAVAKVHGIIPGDTFRSHYRGYEVSEVELKPPYRLFDLDFDENGPESDFDAFDAYIGSLPSR